MMVAVKVRLEVRVGDPTSPTQSTFSNRHDFDTERGPGGCWVSHHVPGLRAAEPRHEK